LEKQQNLILEAARRQQLPYSLIKVSYEPKIEDGQIPISKSPSIVPRGLRMDAADAKLPQKKRPPTPNLKIG
jgi:hypothetical protein